MSDLSKRFPPLNFPEYSLKISKSEKDFFVWDDIRKKKLVLTPEEWVRQHTVEYLIQDKNYAPSLISLEGSLKINNLERRYDVLVYNNSKPHILVECKAAYVKINQSVFDQIARYNLVLNVPYLWVTNGKEHYFAQIDYQAQTYNFLKELPPHLKA